MVRSGIRSDGERSLSRCPRAIRCQSTLHGGPGLARRGRLVPTSRSNQGLHARRLALGSRGLGCAHGRARGWTRLQESVSDVRVARPEVTSLGIVRNGSRATLVGRMRGHRRRMERQVNPLRKRWVGQQRELRLAEERPPRHMARAALTSDACKKGGGPEWRSHVPVRKDRGRLEVQVREGLRQRAARKGLEGEVTGPSGGQRFLGWITSRSTTPCLMRR